MYAMMRLYRRRFGKLEEDEAMTTLHLHGWVKPLAFKAQPAWMSQRRSLSITYVGSNKFSTCGNLFSTGLRKNRMTC